MYGMYDGFNESTLGHSGPEEYFFFVFSAD